jgi:isochorismate hydrolase
MPIPPIAPYAMPAEADLPADRVGWSPEPDRAVLLIHDMQQYFIDPFPAGGSPVTELIRHIVQLRGEAGRLRIPVMYTAQPGAMTRRQRGLLHDIWGPGMDATPAARRIVEPLAAGNGDVVLTKWRYSAFYRTDLRELMERAGRDQLLICGVYGHVGCLMTAADAFTMDLQAFLVADAVADFSRRHHDLALEYTAACCGRVLSTRSLLAALRERKGSARRSGVQRVGGSNEARIE